MPLYDKTFIQEKLVIKDCYTFGFFQTDIVTVPRGDWPNYVYFGFSNSSEILQCKSPEIN